MNPCDDGRRRADVKSLRESLPAPEPLHDLPDRGPHVGDLIADCNAIASGSSDTNSPSCAWSGETLRPASGGKARYTSEAAQAWVKGVGLRLKWTRQIVSNTQMEAGRTIGATQSTLAGWEAGNRLIPQDAAIRVCAAWGVTLDYLYRGLLVGVRPDVAIRLATQHPELVCDPPPPLPPARVAVDRPKALVD